MSRRLRESDFHDVADLSGLEHGLQEVPEAHEADPWASVLSADNEHPLALPLGAFLEMELEQPPPLAGREGAQLLPAGGMVLLAGQAGRGKTTLIVDLLFHLASAVPWLEDFPIERPVASLIVENEGPMHLFQEKLRRKAESWPHELVAEIHVQTLRWGWFSFADQGLTEMMASYLDGNGIELVVGDPLSSLGLDGVGSPAETRAFIQRLVPLGLARSRTFLFPAHFKKEPMRDEIDQLSGAWGGHLDSLLVLKAAQWPEQLRLSFPKLRWWDEEPPRPLILGKLRASAGFEKLSVEGEKPAVDEAVKALLADGVWRTAPEIASAKQGGIGRKRVDVEAALQGNPHLFRWESGAEHGKSARAVVWQLASESPAESAGESAGESEEEFPF